MNDKLNAIILVGGKSSRMGEDKALINYNGSKQVDYLYNLLSPFVNDVFISVNSSQAMLPEYNKFNIIKDIVHEAGPIGGIISAFTKNEDSAFLVAACDLPLINQKMIKEIIKNRDLSKYGTFFSSDYKFEPLFGIYEPKSFPFLLNSLKTKRYGIKNNLKNLDLNIIENNFTDKFKNINTPEERVGFRG